MVCAQRDRGRAGEKEKTGHRAREPQRGCCAATNVETERINERRMVDDPCAQWVRSIISV